TGLVGKVAYKQFFQGSSFAQLSCGFVGWWAHQSSQAITGPLHRATKCGMKLSPESMIFCLSKVTTSYLRFRANCVFYCSRTNTRNTRNTEAINNCSVFLVFLPHVPR